MPLRSFTTSADGRVLAGVCAGIAQALGVDVTLVRVVFALLALAGGAGIVLYFVFWNSRRRPQTVVSPPSATQQPVYQRETVGYADPNGAPPTTPPGV